ncbi:MAG: Lrp/AsnC family transcriptional regulator [Candidatus Iainarchaeum archaeon]|uniref:Lrp/AsnC family transcriptional regulator n=1 Tax=Candidatus Iainarchaeum sp. TaxID=3101447 RepID=A0A7T9DJ86_9ARCH|nr:MAG: Lrp/AsnC family transcriptional regulator [Candidatus Diapherotrites archaeon]
MSSSLSSKERAVFLELSKNARLSDRELAQRLKTSQPTVTRIRSRLLQEQFIDRFMALPNLQKLGLHFQAITFIKAHSPATIKKVVQWVQENPSVVFAGEGEGIRMAQLMVHSLHGDFSEYTAFSKELKEKFAGQLMDVDSFYLDSKSISKFYHWHSVIEERLKKLKEFNDAQAKKLSRRERLSMALQNLSQLKERIPAMPKVGLPGAGKEAKEKEDALALERDGPPKSE